jgi:hypothetical protein
MWNCYVFFTLQNKFKYDEVKTCWPVQWFLRLGHSDYYMKTECSLLHLEKNSQSESQGFIIFVYGPDSKRHFIMRHSCQIYNLYNIFSEIKCILNIAEEVVSGTESMFHSEIKIQWMVSHSVHKGKIHKKWLI